MVYHTVSKLLPIAGSERLTDENVCKTRKTIWIIIMIAFAVGMMVHVGNRVNYYLQDPRSTSVTIKPRMSKRLPAMLFCIAVKSLKKDKKSLNQFGFDIKYYFTGKLGNICNRTIYTDGKYGTYVCESCFSGPNEVKLSKFDFMNNYIQLFIEILGEDLLNKKLVWESGTLYVAIAPFLPKNVAPSVIPFTSENLLQLKLSHDYDIQLLHQKQQLVEDGQCVTTKEGTFGCILECLEDMLKENCGCDHHPMMTSMIGMNKAKVERTRECTDNMTGCITVEHHFTIKCDDPKTTCQKTLNYIHGTVKTFCSHCKPPCIRDVYLPSVINYYTGKLSNTRIKISFTQIQDHNVIEQRVFNNFFAYLSDLGGTLGVWAGGCFMTVILILESLCVAVCTRKKTTTKVTELVETDK